jgi:ATP-dependent protease ClpP protease subunit
MEIPPHLLRGYFFVSNAEKKGPDELEGTAATLYDGAVNTPPHLSSSAPLASVSGSLLTPVLSTGLRFNPDRMVEYLGPITMATNEHVLRDIKDMIASSSHEQIILAITSPGGSSGTAMSLYDLLRSVLKPNLTTIGSGEVDSSAVLIFLAGDTRFVTKHTTMLFHLAGRIFKNDQRFTASEIEAMAREDRLKDEFYAEIVANRSHRALSKKQVLELMSENAVLGPEELISYRLADAILT